MYEHLGRNPGINGWQICQPVPINMCMYRSLPRQSYKHRLASHLVRAPNSRSGGHEFKSPVRQELGAQIKKWKDPSGQVFLHVRHSVYSVVSHTSWNKHPILHSTIYAGTTFWRCCLTDHVFFA
jgi:hypothetical protein